jgi:mannose-6-phosphate isomerase-like protein (cupin superfamily)
MKFVSKSWGYEKWIENSREYCGKHLHVVPPKWCSFHYHKKKKETFYVIGGELLLVYETYSEELAEQVKNARDPLWDWRDSRHDFVDKVRGTRDWRLAFSYQTPLYHQFTTKILKEGDCLTIDPYVLHTFTSNTSSPCDFIEVSTFHEDSDSIRIWSDE